MRLSDVGIGCPPTSGEEGPDAGDKADVMVLRIPAALGADLVLEQVGQPFLWRLAHRATAVDHLVLRVFDVDLPMHQGVKPYGGGRNEKCLAVPWAAQCMIDRSSSRISRIAASRFLSAHRID